MKIIKKNKDNFILFFNRFDGDVDLENIEEAFKKIFLRLNKYYDINIEGFYNVIVYKDDNYGIVLESKVEDGYSFYKQIDMHVILENKKFLYKINDTNIKGKKYFYNNDIYLEVLSLNDDEMLNLIENSEVIYKNVDIIRIKGKLIG